MTFKRSAAVGSGQGTRGECLQRAAKGGGPRCLSASDLENDSTRARGPKKPTLLHSLTTSTHPGRLIMKTSQGAPVGPLHALLSISVPDTKTRFHKKLPPSWLLDSASVPALRATILRPVVALNRIRIRPPARWSRSLALPFVAPLSIDRRRNQIGDAKMSESALAKARKRGVNGGGGRRRIRCRA